jgi:hypothetical protein
MRYTNAC